MYVNTLSRWCHVTFLNKSNQGKVWEDGRSGWDGGKIEMKLHEFNNQSLSSEQKELIGKFKMAAGDVFSIQRIGNEVHLHSNRI